jgi:hypothetical protein
VIAACEKPVEAQGSTRDIYTRTKIITEHLCRRFALSRRLPDSVTRIQGHSSPLQDEAKA